MYMYIYIYTQGTNQMPVAVKEGSNTVTQNLFIFSSELYDALRTKVYQELSLYFHHLQSKTKTT